MDDSSKEIELDLEMYPELVPKIRSIMNTCFDVEHVDEESVNLITVAMEIFLKVLTGEVEGVSDGKEIVYKDIAEIVNTEDKYEFLRMLIPRKITGKQYREICVKKALEEDSSTTDSDNDSTTDSDNDSTTDNSDNDNNSKTDNDTTDRDNGSEEKDSQPTSSCSGNSEVHNKNFQGRVI